MQFALIAGANLTLAESQDEYETIKVRKGTTYIQHGNLLVPQPNLVAEIKPTADDIQRLVDGGSLFLEILGTSWPPVAIHTIDPKLREVDGCA